MDSDSMREYIQNFSLDKCKLGNQGYNRVLLQLFGFAGHGKSCFINSCKYVIDDSQYKIYAETASGGSSQGGKTMKRSSYKLTKTIMLVDNRGCAKMNKDETGEIYAQLGNFLPLDTEVVWQDKGYDASLKKLMNAEREDRSADFIVPLFVYSAETGISNNQVEELKELFDTAKKITGLIPIVVITRERNRNLPDVKEKFRQIGVENMFSLENYTVGDHLKTRGKHETILKCLYELIKDVEFRMGVKRDPIAEKMDRKCFLLKFIHDREQEKAVEEAVQKAVMVAKRKATESARPPSPEKKKSFLGSLFSWF
ncbi:uncharacterized protein [Aquarana catesbeiana]|uniref:uncharacterized protein n=1 Tax=Aquarana catesbeiana TaxID=8400 RepID=UPI003CC99160